MNYIEAIGVFLDCASLRNLHQAKYSVQKQVSSVANSRKFWQGTGEITN